MAGHVTAKREGEPGAGSGEVDLLEDAAQGDDVEVAVRDLEANHALAGDRRLDADGPCGEGHRQVVREALDARHLDRRVGIDLVLGHHRARVPPRHPGRDVEAGQLAGDDRRVALVVHRGAAGARGNVVQQRDRRQVVGRLLVPVGAVRDVGDVERIARHCRSPRRCSDRHGALGSAADHRWCEGRGNGGAAGHRAGDRRTAVLLAVAAPHAGLSG